MKTFFSFFKLLLTLHPIKALKVLFKPEDVIDLEAFERANYPIFMLQIPLGMPKSKIIRLLKKIKKTTKPPPFGISILNCWDGMTAEEIFLETLNDGDTSFMGYAGGKLGKLLQGAEMEVAIPYQGCTITIPWSGRDKISTATERLRRSVRGAWFFIGQKSGELPTDCSSCDRSLNLDRDGTSCNWCGQDIEELVGMDTKTRKLLDDILKYEISTGTTVLKRVK